MLQLVEIVELAAAGRAPRGPEGQHADLAARLETVEDLENDGRRQSEGGAHVVDDERAVGSSETTNDISQWVRRRLEQGSGNALGRAHAEGVA